MTRRRERRRGGDANDRCHAGTKKMPIWVLHRRKPKQDSKTDKVLFAANGNATEADEKYRHTWVAYEVAVNDLREIQNALSTNDFLDNDISVLEQDLNLTTELIRACINANTTNSIFRRTV
jgi:hypothetical protein